jgi:hypothetical protein
MSIIFGRVHWAITKKKKNKKININIYHLLIFNKLLTSSEHHLPGANSMTEGKSSVLPMTNVHA